MSRRLLPALCLIGLAALLSSCGGDGSNGAEQPVRHAPKAVIARANGICRDLLAEIEGIGKGALANPPATTLDLTTQRLVRPSLPVIKRTAARLQALEPAANSKAFDLYANLFDPFVVLTEKRLNAGLEGDPVRARGLEAQLTDLSLVQRRAAQLAGLRDCDVDFPRALLDSLSE